MIPNLKAVDKIWSRTGELETLRLFRKSVYAWVLGSTLLLVPIREQLWSPLGPVAQMPLASDCDSLLCQATNLLAIPGFGSYYQILIFLQFVSCVLSLFEILPRTAALGVLLTTLSLDNRAWVIQDGGNNLIHLLLVYLAFVNPKPRDSATLRGQIDNVLNNCSLFASRLQLCIVYLVAGVAKATGPLWQKGVAIFYVLNTPDYSHPLATKVINAMPGLSVPASYATVAFQISFPFCIWNRTLRPFFLAFGTFLHLQISFVMGLFLFGLAMIVSYTSFTENERASAALRILSTDNVRRYWQRFLNSANSRRGQRELS